MAGLAFAFVASIGLSHGMANAVFPASKGHDYLESRGYTDIQGGQRDYFNACGKDDPARSYQARHPQTQRVVTRTVCHNLLLGAHAPIMGLSY